MVPPWSPEQAAGFFSCLLDDALEAALARFTLMEEKTARIASRLLAERGSANALPLLVSLQPQNHTPTAFTHALMALKRRHLGDAHLGGAMTLAESPDDALRAIAWRARFHVATMSGEAALDLARHKKPSRDELALATHWVNMLWDRMDALARLELEGKAPESVIATRRAHQRGELP